jgi:hypothetical protein
MFSKIAFEMLPFGDDASLNPAPSCKSFESQYLACVAKQVKLVGLEELNTYTRVNQK